MRAQQGVRYDALMKPLIPLCAFMMLCGCGHNDPQHMVEKPPATVEDDISVYFSPHGGAMAAILKNVNAARSTLDVDAYLITSKDIVDALKAAHDRGVKVRIVLDKNNMGGVYSYEAFFKKGAIPVWRDAKDRNAHDKIMLIDGSIIITGSFNFTDQSEDSNAENLLIIRDKPKLFAAYEAQFERILQVSEPPG
jgi:phosphatidylserine/phosphatidylglycerophosphate/cardiolipin synthase-like enzyme